MQILDTQFHNLSCFSHSIPSFLQRISMADMVTSLYTTPPTLPSFFVIFLSVYLLAYFVIFRNWVPKLRTEASSCVMSLAHGTPAVIMTVHATLFHAGGSASSPTFSAPNTLLQDTVLEFSLAYFLMDLLHYFVFFPRDILFILHHVATLYVLATCRYVVHHGAYGLLGLLVLAESTSACQNVWTLASLRKHDVPFAASLFGVVSPPFYAFYSVVRGVLGPVYVVNLVKFYVSGEANVEVPGWAWISWVLVIGTAILVSISWVLNNWKNWYNQRTCLLQKKVD